MRGSDVTKPIGPRYGACIDCRDWIVGVGKGRLKARCDLCWLKNRRLQDRKRYPPGSQSALDRSPRSCATVGCDNVIVPAVKGTPRRYCGSCTKDRQLEASRRHRQKLGAAHFSAASRRSLLKRKWGISAEEFDRILESQDGRCAICASPEAGGAGGWHIDHDHGCCPPKSSCGNCIRGLLCTRCNTGLGLFRDSAGFLRRAAEYVERPLKLRLVS